MQDWKEVVKGGKVVWTVKMTKATGWNSSEGGWTWKLFIGAEATPGTAVISGGITSDSATISTVTNTNDLLTVVWTLSNTNSALLSDGSYLVDIKATEASPSTIYYYWWKAAGRFNCRTAYGGA